MRKLQQTFYLDPVDFGVRKEEDGMPEMQEPQNQATDILFSNSDIQEELGCPKDKQGPLAGERMDMVFEQGERRAHF
jgi:hypothetical protein